MTHATTRPAVDFWVQSGEVRIHGMDWGGAAHGTPIIMLHGIGGTAMSFNMLGPRLSMSIGDRHRIASIDQRGSGDSDKPEHGYGQEYFAADVQAVIEAMGGGPAVLVGHSRGGWLAPFVAACKPGLVDRLILIDPARMSYESAEAQQAFYARVRAGLGPFGSAQDALTQAMSDTPDAYWGPERKQSELNRLYPTFDGRLFGKMPRRVLDALERVRGDDVLRPVTSEITAATLLFVSSRSDERRQAQKLEYAERIPGTRVVMLDGTHSLQHDCVEAVAAEIETHLSAA